MLGKKLIKAAAGNAGGANPYIEDVFSTYLYTGNGSTQTITNGIDLAGEGGLVWLKARESETFGANVLIDTERGRSSILSIGNTSTTLSTDAERISLTGRDLSSFNSDGFSLGLDQWFNKNTNTETYVSWTFRKAPKFFDCVTYTGTGVARTIAHNLGSVPGCIIIKRVDATGSWIVYHRSLDASAPEDYNLSLESTSARAATNAFWNNTSPTNTGFTVGTASGVNASGGTYVAYLFAHDAGGFGDAGDENVISCGSYAGNSSTTGPVIDLGWEPQWILVKAATTTQGWILIDSMRALNVTSSGDTILGLRAEASDAEFGTRAIIPTATGFQPVTTAALFNQSGQTYIYIAIRRGPMKTPTSGTEVFTPITKTGDAPTATLSEIGFQFDAVFNSVIAGIYVGSTYANRLSSRLTRLGPSSSQALETSSNAAEASYAYSRWDGQTFSMSSGWGATNKNAWYFFKRAPGFMDVCCYTGTGVARTVDHNLGVAPEMMIVKNRGATWNWAVYHSVLGATKFLLLDSTGRPATQSTVWNDTAPTSSVFTVGSSGYTGASSNNYVAYLFATLAGVSKVGSYTGTGTTQQIDCGFSSGARFVLIRRAPTDLVASNWYVWDSARGIVAGNDPYLLLNSTAAEVTSTDYIDPLSSGFEISSTAPAEINESGTTFIFLAIA